MQILMYTSPETAYFRTSLFSMHCLSYLCIRFPTCHLMYKSNCLNCLQPWLLGC